MSLKARRGGQSLQQVDRSMHSMVAISHTNRGYYILIAILKLFRYNAVQSRRALEPVNKVRQLRHSSMHGDTL